MEFIQNCLSIWQEKFLTKMQCIKAKVHLPYMNEKYGTKYIYKNCRKVIMYYHYLLGKYCLLCT